MKTHLFPLVQTAAMMIRVNTNGVPALSGNQNTSSPVRKCHTKRLAATAIICLLTSLGASLATADSSPALLDNLDPSEFRELSSADSIRGKVFWVDSNERNPSYPGLTRLCNRWNIQCIAGSGTYIYRPGITGYKVQYRETTMQGIKLKRVTRWARH